MIETINKLEALLATLKAYISASSNAVLSQKASPEKWSKKEILGHLIDSGINNLQRFTEIQFEAKPYKIRKYNQVQLVKANNYEAAEVEEIIGFLLSVNARIQSIMHLQTPKTLNYEIDLGDGKISDLKFLMKDYVDHFEHHVNQVVN